MPELPEVETVKRTLEPLVVNRSILSVEILYPGILKYPECSQFVDLLPGKVIESLKRRGKYLLFELSDCYALVIHLRMTGRLVACPAGSPLAKHTHLLMHLSGGMDLRFVDLRKFGMVYLVDPGEWEKTGSLPLLGVEPLGEEFTPFVLETLLAGKKRGLKSFLLDQSQIAGIGNIYADEILFAAGLHPERNTSSLTREEMAGLYRAIRRVLSQGVEDRGTSVRDYVDGKGEKGRFQEKLQAYGRGGKPCLRCGTGMARKTVAGRSTVFCPSCQR